VVDPNTLPERILKALFAHAVKLNPASTLGPLVKLIVILSFT